MPHAANAFTLIEMVTVIAILVILMTVSVNLLHGSGSQSRKAGTDMLCGLIEQARTTAISSRSEVFLAVAEPGDIPGADDRCRVGLFRKKAAVSTDSTTSEARYDLISRWKTLNSGIVILGGNVAGAQVDKVRNPLDEPKMKIIYGAKNLEISVHVISINSRGGLVIPHGSDPILFRIAEGGYRNGKATPNLRGDSHAVSETILKIGRVTARPYQIN